MLDLVGLKKVEARHVFLNEMPALIEFAGVTVRSKAWEVGVGDRWSRISRCAGKHLLYTPRCYFYVSVECCNERYGKNVTKVYRYQYQHQVPVVSRCADATSAEINSPESTDAWWIWHIGCTSQRLRYMVAVRSRHREDIPYKDILFRGSEMGFTWFHQNCL